MEEQNFDLSSKYLRSYRRRKIWRKIVSTLACLVVFCTTYALILPAITLETDPVCGLAEHAHDDSCYTLIASEIVQELSCTLDESSPHVHDEACYGTAPGALLCPEEETPGHIHDDTCRNENGDLVCGLEELSGHSHDPSCYEQYQILICTEGETHVHSETCYTDVETALDTEALTCTLSESEDHTHTALCYGTWELTCELTEHTHTSLCRTDPTADVETEAMWTAAFADIPLTGQWDKDLLAIAQSQLGYQESTRNYEVAEDGETTRGYTRYGDWYGMPFGDWDAMFVSFCLHYAGVEGFPLDDHCPSWVEAVQEQNMYAPASAYLPSAGDIIFFDQDADASADHVGIVAEYFPADGHDAAQIRCIEGDSDHAVRYTTYNLPDSCILGYGQLPSGQAEFSDDGEFPDTAEDDTLAAIANVVAQETDDAAMYSALSRSVMRMTSSPAASARSTVITGTTDMKPLIDAVTVYKKQNGAWVKVESGGTVTQGEELKFTIDYTVHGMVLSDEVNTLVYTIPDNISNVRDSTGSVYNDSKQEVGTFTVDASSNTITITFFDDYVEENGDLNKAIEGSISFFATVENVTQQGGKPTEILFADKVKIEMEVAKKEESKGDVKVEKSIATVNGTEITYQIKVSSETGTYSEVTLTDKMTTQAEWWTEGHLTFNPNSLTVNTDSYELYYHYNEFTVVLPQMAAGGEYIITYTAELTGELNGHPLVNNKATATSKDSLNIDISDFAEVDHTFKALDKSGKRKEDGSVEWRIVINEDKADISGNILRDVMTDTDGSTAEFIGPVTLTDSKGNSTQIKLPYTFPAGSSDTYTITYVTTHEEVSGENVVVNNVRLQYGDSDDLFSDGEEVVIGTNNPLSKEGKFLSTDPETGKSLIQWTVTVDTSGGPLPAMSYIRDAMYEDVLYLTYEQLKAAFAAVENAIKPYQICGNTAISGKCKNFFHEFVFFYFFDNSMLTATAANYHNFHYIVQSSPQLSISGGKVSF